MNSLTPSELYPLITEVADIFKKTGKPFWLGGGIKQKKILLEWISLDSGEDHPWVAIIRAVNEK